jgi:hypothetical protein
VSANFCVSHLLIFTGVSLSFRCSLDHCSLRGLQTSAEFCESVSYGHLLERIRTPTLFITAEDDPICPAKATPLPRTGNTAVVRTSAGGHIAFVTPTWPILHDDWDTSVALDFISAVLGGAGGVCSGDVIPRAESLREGATDRRVRTRSSSRNRTTTLTHYNTTRKSRAFAVG